MPLRILHVLFSLDAGGMENGVVNVASALSPSEFRLHAVCLSRGGEFVHRFPNPADVRILRKHEGFSLSTVWALSHHIRTLAPDVIHTHNLGPLLYTVLAAPSVPILHGEHAQLNSRELIPHRLLIRRLLYLRANRVHTVSHSLRDSLVRQGFRAAKIDVIVNGVDTTRFQPRPRDAARRAAGLPLNACILGLVGRFGPYKRHIELIQAFEQIAPAHPTLALLFIGGGGDLEAATRARAASSPYSGRIHFAGFQPDPAPWYPVLDLLVLPSINEGLSNALIESMASGIPALAHTACGNSEVIEDSVNGYLRDLSTPARLHAALASVLANPNPSLGKVARTTIDTRFTFPAMVAGYQSLYHQLAHTRPTSAPP